MDDAVTIPASELLEADVRLVRARFPFRFSLPCSGRAGREGSA